jgi:hypothetical protein
MKNKTCPPCTQNCSQGKNCQAHANDYRKNFYQFGQIVPHTPPRWNIWDLMLVVLAVGCIAGVVAGVFG